MPSRASCFSFAVYRKNLTRFLPLWIGYFLLWLVLLPLSVLTRSGQETFTQRELAELILCRASDAGAIVTMLYAGAIALAFHGRLYRGRSVDALAALPIRREGWFLTDLAAALTVSAVPNVLIALLTAAASAAAGMAGFPAAMTWLGAVSLEFVFFYGLAALCAAVVGQALAMPVLYGMANFAALVLSYVVSAVLSAFVYGLGGVDYLRVLPFSPAADLWANAYVSLQQEDAVAFQRWGYLGILAAVGAAFLLAAFLLQRKRRMETAGDLIAVKPLRPVLKYCFTAGCALVLGTLAADVFYVNDAVPLWVLTLCMLGGGFVGYFLAEMLLKKTLRVFRREWIGFGAFALCLLAAVGALELDLLGYERRVPEAGDVAGVELSAFGYWGSLNVEDAAYIADLITLHQSLIDEKAEQEDLYRRYSLDGSEIDASTLTLTYSLRDGGTLRREYRICCTAPMWYDAGSLPRRYADLLRDPYLLELARTPSAEAMAGAEGYCWIQCYHYNEIGTPEEDSMTLDDAETRAFYAQCLLPDLREGLIGYEPPFRFEDLSHTEYDASVYLGFERRVLEQGGSYSVDSFYQGFTPTVGSRTAAWLEDRGCKLTLRSEQE